MSHVTITLNPKVGNSTISNYSSKLEQAVEKLVWQQKIGIVKVRSTGESKHTTSKGCQNTKKLCFIVMPSCMPEKLEGKIQIHESQCYLNLRYNY